MTNEIPNVEQLLSMAATFAVVILPFIITAIFNLRNKHKRH